MDVILAYRVLRASCGLVLFLKLCARDSRRYAIGYPDVAEAASAHIFRPPEPANPYRNLSEPTATGASLRRLEGPTGKFADIQAVMLFTTSAYS